MSKKDIRSLGGILKKPLSIKIERMYSARVHQHWGFSDRINENQHLIYIRGGKGFYILAGKEVTLERGTLIFVSRGFLHSAGFRGEDNPQILPVRFSFYSEKESANDIVTSPFCLVHSILQKDYVESLLDRLFFLTTSSAKNLLIDNEKEMLLRLVLHLFLENTSGNFKDPRVRAALNMIHQSPNRYLSNKELADSVSLSTKQIIRLFVKETGRTPSDYVRQFRINYAAEELAGTEKSISEIAFQLGFPDVFTFSKQFKKYKGVSPSMWRNEKYPVLEDWSYMS